MARGAARGESAERALRHHLLEGLLRRLARGPHVDRLVVRGGLMTRAWVGRRPTSDLDLVGVGRFDLDVTAARLQEIVDTPVDDGLRYGELRTHGIWLHTDWPGVRGQLTVEAEGARQSLTIDIGFGDPLVPPAVTFAYPTLLDAPDAVIVACRPETQVAWKLHGLAEFADAFRPKDLADLWRIGAAVPLDAPLLTAAIDAAFVSRRFTRAQAVGVLELPHWRTKGARVRFGSPPGLPPLAQTLDAVRAWLDPALRALERA